MAIDTLHTLRHDNSRPRLLTSRRRHSHNISGIRHEREYVITIIATPHLGLLSSCATYAAQAK